MQVMDTQHTNSNHLHNIETKKTWFPTSLNMIKTKKYGTSC